MQVEQSRAESLGNYTATEAPRRLLGALRLTLSFGSLLRRCGAELAGVPGRNVE